MTRILNAERRLALVELAGGAVVPVPYGVGRPRVGHRYPVYSTPQGDRWLKAGGQTFCETWTLDEDFNEDGATFRDDMAEPAGGDRLVLVTGYLYGDGRDGPVTAGTGAYNLNHTSICGRSEPDAAYYPAAAWTDSDTPGHFGMVMLSGGGSLDPLAVGDEIAIYVQHRDVGSEITFVGYWETHRIAAIDGGNVYYDEPGGFVGTTDYSVLVQRVPNYTDGGDPGVVLTVDPFVSFAGSGFLMIRASAQFRCRIDLAGCGYQGGLYTGWCSEEDGVKSDTGWGLRTFDPVNAGAGDGGFTDCCALIPENDTHPYSASGSNNSSPYNHTPLTGTMGGGGGGGAAGADGSGNPHRIGAFGGNHDTGLAGGDGGVSIRPTLSLPPGLPTGTQTANTFRGLSRMGGGGGAAGFAGGTGGAGGGVAIVITPEYAIGHTFTLPSIVVTGTDGTDGGGGGAGGSALIWAEDINTPHVHAERRSIVDGATGIGSNGGSLGSGTSCGFIYGGGAGGAGGVGSIFVHYQTGNVDHLHGATTTEAGGPPEIAGCWGSAIRDSESLGLDPGLLVEPTALRADWTLDSDGLAPTFYLEGGDQPDLSDGVIYPQTEPRVWQDGGDHDIDDDSALDLAPYAPAPALYWRVWACLDSGTDSTDTPTVDEIRLCGVAF